MKKSKKLARRDIFKIGAGLVTSAIATKGQAANILCNSPTPSQPLGPFFPREDTPIYPVRENPNSDFPLALANDNDLTFIQGKNGSANGERIQIFGKLTDANCNPVPNATIVIWQASDSGRYNHKQDSANPDFKHPISGKQMKRSHDENFQYWGKNETDENGNYKFLSILPGFYPADIQQGWFRPPHIHFLVSAMGHPQYVTQMYFDCPTLKDNGFIQDLNKKDLLLQNVKEKQKDLIIRFEPSDSEGVPTNLKFLNGNFNIQLPS